MAFGIMIWLALGVVVAMIFGGSARTMGTDRKTVSC